MEPRRPQALDAGLFTLIVGLPLVVFPLAHQPYADPKLVVLMPGTLLLWVAGTGVDRRLAVAAGIWAAACVLSALGGVDPAGSVLGPWDSTGLLLLLASAALLPVASAIQAEAWDRARGWLVWVAVGTTGVAVAWRLVPDALDTAVRDLSFRGATLGNPVFAVACCCPRRSPPPHVRVGASVGSPRSLLRSPPGSPSTASAARSCFRRWRCSHARGPSGPTGGASSSPLPRSR